MVISIKPPGECPNRGQAPEKIPGGSETNIRRPRKDLQMHFRKITAAFAAAVMTLACGCSIRSSSDAAWPTGAVEDKKALTISVDEFNKKYKFWLTLQQIPDDTASEVAEECASQRSDIIDSLINEKILLDQAEKLGITLTEEDQAEIDESYNTLIDQYIESYKSSVNAGESGTGEVNGEAAILKQAEKLFDDALTACGMTRDDILLAVRSRKISDKLKQKLAESTTVEYSDAEAEYKELVDGVRQLYEDSPEYYESYSYYSYYWIPENSRMIKHILLSFEDADKTDISTLRTNGDDEAADSARAAAYEKIQPQAEDIIRQLDEGADFDEMIKQYSKDPGSTSNPNGYLVVPNGGIYYKEFQQGAYELEKIGDYKLAITDIGCHIMLYAADAKVDEETTKDILDVLYSQLQEDAADTAYVTAMQQWRSEYDYDIAYKTLNIEQPAATAESAAVSGTTSSPQG